MRKLALNDEILMKVEKPARYIGNEVNSVMKDNDINFHPKFDIVSYSLVKDFAKIGMGISYITKEFAKEELGNDLLFEIPLKEKIPDRGLGIVLPKNTITSFATQKFIEILKM